MLTTNLRSFVRVNRRTANIRSNWSSESLILLLAVKIDPSSCKNENQRGKYIWSIQIIPVLEIRDGFEQGCWKRKSPVDNERTIREFVHRKKGERLDAQCSDVLDAQTFPDELDNHLHLPSLASVCRVLHGHGWTGGVLLHVFRRQDVCGSA